MRKIVQIWKVNFSGVFQIDPHSMERNYLIIFAPKVQMISIQNSVRLMKASGFVSSMDKNIESTSMVCPLLQTFRTYLVCPLSEPLLILLYFIFRNSQVTEWIGNSIFNYNFKTP